MGIIDKSITHAHLNFSTQPSVIFLQSPSKSVPILSVILSTAEVPF